MVTQLVELGDGSDSGIVTVVRCQIVFIFF